MKFLETIQAESLLLMGPMLGVMVNFPSTSLMMASFSISPSGSSASCLSIDSTMCFADNICTFDSVEDGVSNDGCLLFDEAVGFIIV